ncbi:class I SAM-dependent methyltransferase [Nocardiopsis xinjiangensis]|uniref:class I SAM-dependent methyltransferase n=1 Tax=Nocardiopsis xinjiangensis TaxID=124285 RepID=UPI000349AECF|nr:class I SAM-dependent methyltransferase [Nocardiopsis xinjiangensis]
MFSPKLAEIYEEMYRGRGKDWDDEAQLVIDHIRRRLPDADSLLDIACGTGAHLKEFDRGFSHAEGVDVEEAMLNHARQRVPGVTFTQGDMRDFDCARTYDAVTCMFCSIAYLETVEDLTAAVWNMARHLEPGGVLVIEPWWFPEQFIDGYLRSDSCEGEGRSILRMSHTVRKGRASHMEVRFLVGDSGGISEFTEIDILTLFAKEEYERAFAEAGCPAEYFPGAPTGRGLFVGVRS